MSVVPACTNVSVKYLFACGCAWRVWSHDLTALNPPGHVVAHVRHMFDTRLCAVCLQGDDPKGQFAVEQIKVVEAMEKDIFGREYPYAFQVSICAVIITVMVPWRCCTAFCCVCVCV